MPERKTIERARRCAREGWSPSAQAGEFVREGCTMCERAAWSTFPQTGDRDRPVQSPPRRREAAGAEQAESLRENKQKRDRPSRNDRKGQSHPADVLARYRGALKSELRREAGCVSSRQVGKWDSFPGELPALARDG